MKIEILLIIKGNNEIYLKKMDLQVSVILYKV